MTAVRLYLLRRRRDLDQRLSVRCLPSSARPPLHRISTYRRFCAQASACRFQSLAEFAPMGSSSTELKLGWCMTGKAQCTMPRECQLLHGELS